MRVSVMEKILVLKLIIAASAVVTAAAATVADVSDGGSLDANELSISNTDFLPQVSENKIASNQWESMEERKNRCSPTPSCTKAGGVCVNSSDDCSTGTVDRNGCKGGFKCMCCIPDQSTPAPCPTTTPTTCPDVTSPASTPCPTSIPTTYTSARSCPFIKVTCLAGEFQIENQCFKRYSTLKTWTAAQAYCLSQGLQLAQPAYPKRLHDYLTQDGLTSGRHWLGGRGTGSIVGWLNGTSISNSSSLWAWGVNGVSSDWGLDLLTSSNADAPLNMDGITSTRAFVCERNVVCLLTEFRIGNQCFKRYSTLKTWTAAQAYCISQGLQLAQPAYPKRLHQYLTLNGWTSGRQSRHWLGGRGTGSVVAWLNGTTISNSNSLWAWGVNGVSSEHGLDLLTTDYAAAPLDMDGITITRAFVCERNGCLSGGFEIGNQCFKRYSTLKTWTAAQAYCTSRGLQLAQPADPKLLHLYLTWNGWTSGRHWLGGRGTGSVVGWLNGTTISNSSSLWAWGVNGVSSDYGLDLLPTSSNADAPLDMDSITETRAFVCEQAMDKI